MKMGYEKVGPSFGLFLQFFHQLLSSFQKIHLVPQVFKNIRSTPKLQTNTLKYSYWLTALTAISLNPKS